MLDFLYLELLSEDYRKTGNGENEYMETKKRSKIKVYMIFTNKELDEKKYSTQGVKIEGCFISFKPCAEMHGKDVVKYEADSDLVVILPHHVIKEIRYMDRD
jgi:hypothetical protein